MALLLKASNLSQIKNYYHNIKNIKLSSNFFWLNVPQKCQCNKIKRLEITPQQMILKQRDNSHRAHL